MKKLIFEIDDECLREATITFFGVRRDVIQRNTIDLDLNHNTTMVIVHKDGANVNVDGLAIKQLIDLETFDAKDARPSAKWVCMDNVYRLHAGECNLSAAKCSNCNSVICDIFHVSEMLLYCPVCGARMDGKEVMQP